MPAALYALVLAAFAIGTTEFVIMGLLPEVAADLAISIPKAGVLVSGYAMGVVVGGPALAAATATLGKKRALCALFGIFIAGNVLCATAMGFATLMLARMVTAFAHGTFLGVAAVVAMQIAPKGRDGEAMGYVLAGITLANVLGVPAGMALGQAMGWRAAFWGVAILACIALVLLQLTLPALPAAKTHSIRDEFAALGNPRMLTALALCAACSATLLCLFTFIAPFLQQVTCVTPGEITQILMGFGTSLTVGTLLGGRLSGANLWQRIGLGLVAAAVILAALPWLGQHLVPCIIALCLWGAISFGLCPLLQTLVMSHAGRAPTLAATLTHSAFNLGNATGAWVGAWALSAGQPIKELPWTCIGLSCLALAITWVSARLGPTRQLA